MDENLGCCLLFIIIFVLIMAIGYKTDDDFWKDYERNRLSPEARQKLKWEEIRRQENKEREQMGLPRLKY